MYSAWALLDKNASADEPQNGEAGSRQGVADPYRVKSRPAFQPKHCFYAAARYLARVASAAPILESILPRLPSEGQAWLNGLNPFCRRAVEHDLRFAGPDLFVQYWESLRDTLQRLEREFGPSDNWK